MKAFHHFPIIRQNSHRLIMRTILILPALGAAAILSAPIMIVAILLLLFSVLARLISSFWERDNVQTHYETHMFEYDSEIGWRLRPNLDLYGIADEPFHVTTGPDGWRGNLPIEDADLVVFGDSFAFGHGVDENQMFTKYSGNLKVKSIGVNGYGMVQGMLWMRRLAPSLAGKLVVWFIYYGNDLHENLQPDMETYRMPFVRQRPESPEWEVVTEHLSKEPWSFRAPAPYYQPLAELCCPTKYADRVFSAVEYLISEARTICHSAGTTLVVVGVPERLQLNRRGLMHLQKLASNNPQFNANLPDERLNEICNRLDIRFESLTTHLKPNDHLANDVHWQPSGHQKVGALIQRLYEESDMAAISRAHPAAQFQSKAATKKRSRIIA